MTDTDCLFCKFVSGELDADVVHETESVLAFRDINPQAPTHVLLIPKKEIPSVDDLTPEDHALAGHLLLTAQRVAQQLGLDDGYRLVVNNGRAAGQEVPHLHLHILGGRGFQWPPG